MNRVKVALGLACFGMATAVVVASLSSLPVATAVGATTGPATAPAFDYKPGVDKVIDELRDDTLRDSAERIMRGFPEAALPIAKADLTTRLADFRPDVIAEATRILDRNHEARAHRVQGYEAEKKWNEGTATSAYAAVGHRNPAWDDDVVKSILAYMDGTPNAKLMASADAAGCDDPFFKYVEARVAQNTNKSNAAKLLDEACDGLMASNYPAYRRATAAANDVLAHVSAGAAKLSEKEKTALKAQLDDALGLFPEIAKDPTIPAVDLYDLADTLDEDYGQLLGDQLLSMPIVYPVVLAAMPHSNAPLDLKGGDYLNSALDARGMGLAADVTPQAWQLVGDRLKVAREALSQSVALDSFDSLAASAMVNVALVEGSGKAEMEKWFIKALEADPDDVEPYENKVNFLQPKWYGTPEELLAFGRECVATQNLTDPAIPMTMVLAHEELSAYKNGVPIYAIDRNYFKDNAVAWSDISAAINPVLVAYPDDYSDRSMLAKFAVWCGQYDEANKQFKILGGKGDSKQFGSVTNMRALRQEAADHATPAAP